MSNVATTQSPNDDISSVAKAIVSAPDRRNSKANRQALAEAVAAFHSRTGLAPTRLGLIRFGGRVDYAACIDRRSNSAGLIWPSVE